MTIHKYALCIDSQTIYLLADQIVLRDSMKVQDKIQSYELSYSGKIN